MNDRRESNPVAVRDMNHHLENLKQVIFSVESQRDCDLLWDAYQKVADSYQGLKRVFIKLYNADLSNDVPTTNKKLLANLRWIYSRLVNGETVTPGDPWFAMAHDAIEESQQNGSNEKPVYRPVFSTDEQRRFDELGGIRNVIAAGMAALGVTAETGEA